MIGSSVRFTDKYPLQSANSVESYIVKYSNNFILLSYASIHQYRKDKLNSKCVYKNTLFGFTSLEDLNSIENYVKDKAEQCLAINKEVNYVITKTGHISKIDSLDPYIYHTFYLSKFDRKLLVKEEELPKTQFFPIYLPTSIEMSINVVGELEMRYNAISSKEACTLCLTNYLNSSYFMLLTIKEEPR